MHGAYTISDFSYKVMDGGKIQLLDCIGQGSFGVVFRARDLTNLCSSLLAVKIIPKDDKVRLYRRELVLHGMVQGHPHIASIRKAFSDKYFMYIVLDYCPAGDLWRAIKAKKVFWGNDALVRNVFLQIVDAVAFCHEKGVYHRDLKPNNVLISPNNRRVWLTDFGLASMTKESRALGVGTQQYRSPECNNSLGDHLAYNAVRNDIWALGIILINMLTGVMPWAIANEEDGWYQTFVSSDDFLRYTLPISREADTILRLMLTEREQDCISLAEVHELVAQVEHFWMSDEEIARAEPHVQRVAKTCRPEPPKPNQRPLYVPIPPAEADWSSSSSWARSPSILAAMEQSPLARPATSEKPASTFVNTKPLPSDPADSTPAPAQPQVVGVTVAPVATPLPVTEKKTSASPSSETYVNSDESRGETTGRKEIKRKNAWVGVHHGMHKFGVRQRLRQLFTHHA